MNLGAIGVFECLRQIAHFNHDFHTQILQRNQIRTGCLDIHFTS
jgi:hypothetical protein